MSLRNYLEQRERELLHELRAFYTSISKKEAELAEVRRAMAAIGMPTPSSASDEEVLRSTTVGEFVERTSPYQNMTMKQLVVKALKEHFNDGATTRELLTYFRDAWDRDIKRLSLSPQLNRLLQAGIIQKSVDNDWVLAKDDAEVPDGDEEESG